MLPRFNLNAIARVCSESSGGRFDPRRFHGMEIVDRKGLAVKYSIIEYFTFISISPDLYFTWLKSQLLCQPQIATHWRS